MIYSLHSADFIVFGPSRAHTVINGAGCIFTLIVFVACLLFFLFLVCCLSRSDFKFR